MRCYRCGISEEKARLINAIFEGQVVKLCPECLEREDAIIIRKPTTQQLKESEKPYTVKERLRRMAGYKEKNEVKEVIEKIQKAEKKPEEKDTYKIDKPLKLVDNYNWLIMIERKKKKLTRQQLAKLIGESEMAIKMIENKELPEDAEKLIRKLEQYFRINLFKKDEQEEFKETPTRIIKFDEEKIKNITLSDLQELKKEKEKLDEKQGDIKIEKVDEKGLELKFNQEIVKKLTIADLKKIKKVKEKEGIEEAQRLIAEIEKEEQEKERELWKQEAEKSLLGSDIELDD